MINSSIYYDLYTFVLSLEAVFERGVVSLSGINMFNTVGHLSHFSPGGIRKVAMDYKKGVYSKGYEYTFFESIKDFVEKYVAGKSAPTTGEQALFNMKLEKLISISHRRHEKVYVDGVKFQ